MSKLEQLQLQAGGFVRVAAKVDVKATEEVVARDYGSKALGDRVVVRLSADRLGPAEDLAMEYLGLETRGTSKPLAQQTKRALGFANWALTHHPKHAKYALGLVKRIKATARRAKSKPGHAWDELSEMADELNKSVRHFLPAFWEEAARIYKDLGNQTYAGRSLNKALEAERVHALEVDREHRREAVLEFTLSGCLSGKALSEYAKDLQSQFEPAEAYETLRDLVVRRTLGGMAPTANMGKDLMRLAKAANLETDAEVEAVLEEIVSSPAMARAPLQFWKSVKSNVKRLVERSQLFAIWLLVHTDPQTRYSGDSMVWSWLELLDQWGVLPQLWSKELPAEPEIPGGRAGWIGRLARLEESPDKLVLDLIENMADVLRREDQSVPLFVKSRWKWSEIDVDVLEAFLDLGIELGEVPEDVPLAFGGWLRAEVDHPRRNSQLTHVAADPRFAPALRASIPELVKFTGESARSHYSYARQLATRRAFEEAAVDHPAIYDAWWQYLDEQLIRLEQGGLPDAERAIANLHIGVGPKTAQQFPELAQRLNAVDLVDNLHRTLVAGVFDEYGWDVLEQADEQHKLPARRKHGGGDCQWLFPFVTYHRDTSLVVVGPDRADPPRELVLKARQDLVTLLPICGDVLIAYRDQNREWSTFLLWASDRDGEVKCDSLYGFSPTAIVPWGDGGFCGSRVVKPGDKKLFDTRPFYHDTQRFWQLREQVRYYRHDDEGVATLVEIDPETGKELRESVPPWFEDLPAGATISWSESRLLPLPTGLQSSPLGSQDGLIGWKVLRRRDGTLEGCGIDGRRIALGDYADKPHYQSQVPLAMMDQPAGDAHWVFTDSGLVIDSKSGHAIADFRGTRTSYGDGQPTQIPVDFLHLMRVRHVASSKLLRKIARADAAKILQAGATEHEARKHKETEGKPERVAASVAVEKLLPKAPPRLVKGVARIARLCAEEQISLDKLRTLDPSKMVIRRDSDERGAAPASRISEGMQQLEIPRPGSSYYYGSGEATNCEEHLREVGRFLAGEIDGPVPPCGLPWLNLWRDISWIAWRCFWRLATVEGQFTAVSDRVRQPWLEALEFIADSGMLDLPGSFRIYIARPLKDKEQKGSSPIARRQQKTSVWVQGDSRYLAQILSAHPQDTAHILEYAPKGVFQAPDGFAVEQSEDVQHRWNGKQLQAFVAAARQVEKLPLATAEQIESAAEQLQVTPIEVAIVWMGNLRTVSYGNDKLTKEVRSHYGWKVKPVQEAIASLEASSIPPAVVSAPVRHDPVGVFGDGQAQVFGTLIAAWKETQGAAVRMPPELIALLEKAGGPRGATESLIRLLTDRSKAALLQRRKISFAVGEKGYRYRSIGIQYDPPKDEDDDTILADLPFSIRLINYAAPAGDAARRRLPDVIDAVRKFFDRKTTVFPFGLYWAAADIEKFDAGEIMARFSQTLGKSTLKKGVQVCDDKYIMAALDPPFVQLAFRSAGLVDKEDFQRLVAVSSLTYGWEGTGERAVDMARVVWQLRSDAMTRIADNNRDNPVQDGCWEQDPRHSAPKTVAAVKKKHKLNEDSAVAYLQLLALPDPTNANICKWNDWSAKQLKESIAPLLEAEHVVEAKRSRAGRGVFLPGGWEALKTPNLPIESWKLPLFGVDPARIDVVRYRLIVPRGPVGDLFAAAWNRVTSGDRPQYEEAV